MKFKEFLKENYQGNHRPPNKNNGAPLHNIAKIYPDDVYENMMMYASDFSQKEAANIIKKYRNKPDEIINIYRAVPKGIKIINPNDWVAITKKYAFQHAKHPNNPKLDFDVIHSQTLAKNLFNDGNSFEEWGYDGDEVLTGIKL